MGNDDADRHGEEPHAPHRLRKAFAVVVPEGLEIIESGKTGEFPVNPGVVIESVNWEALAEHLEGEVQKAAREQLRRRRRGAARSRRALPL